MNLRRVYCDPQKSKQENKMLRNLISAGYNKSLATPFLVASNLNAQQLRVSAKNLISIYDLLNIFISDNFRIKKTNSGAVAQEKSEANQASWTSLQL